MKIQEKIFCTVIAIVIMFSSIAMAALIDDQKSQYLNDMRALADLMVLVRERSKEMDQKWASLALGIGETNEFIQADIDATIYSGLTVAELTSCVTTAQGYETWFNVGHDDNMQKIRQ